MATKTQTPITLLAEAVRQLCLVSDKPELCISSRCADARAALEDVEALVRALAAIQVRCEEGDKRSDWLPTIASICRTALAKFQEAKS